MNHTQNMTERAARAEALAERMSVSLSAALAALDLINDGYPSAPEQWAPMKDGSAALDAWEAHKADLDTLAQADREASKDA